MADNPQANGAFYREKAREIRRFAWGAQSNDVCCELLETADRFDRMAAHVEKRRRPAEGIQAGLDHFTVHNPTPVVPTLVEREAHP